MASVVSGSEARDEPIKFSELLDVDQSPTATFRSTSMKRRGSRGTVHGASPSTE